MRDADLNRASDGASHRRHFRFRKRDATHLRYCPAAQLSARPLHSAHPMSVLVPGLQSLNLYSVEEHGLQSADGGGGGGGGGMPPPHPPPHRPHLKCGAALLPSRGPFAFRPLPFPLTRCAPYGRARAPTAQSSTTSVSSTAQGTRPRITVGAPRPPPTTARSALIACLC